MRKGGNDVKFVLKKSMRSVCALLIAAVLCTSAAALPKTLIPGGNTVGIRLCTNGLFVTDVEDDTPAQTVGIRAGDTIMAVNSKRCSSVDMLRSAVAEGGDVRLRIRRGGKTAEYLVTPRENRLGVRVRDGISGIGTVTYYDPEDGSFGALGHGVCLKPDGTLLPLCTGFLVASEISDVQKGQNGTPGELHGCFDVSRSIGTVRKNNDCGIFGTAFPLPNRAAVPLGQPHTGQAQLRSNVDGGSVGVYCVELEKISEGDGDGREILLRVTDRELLEKTGGIVQGMSGSPILQDGRLVGAVTHVLVNDPTRGYGISVQRMLQAA